MTDYNTNDTGIVTRYPERAESVDQRGSAVTATGKGSGGGGLILPIIGKGQFPQNCCSWICMYFFKKYSIR